MRRILTLALAALVLIAGAAAAAEVGVGAYGGISIPILNDLSKQGTEFGGRIPVRVMPLIIVEPFFSTSSLGDVDETFGSQSYTRDGGDVSAFGANVLFTFGENTRLFPYAGIGSYNLTRDGSDDVTDVGYNFGLGFGFPVIPKLLIDVRGEFTMVVTDETSQKFGKVLLGATYRVFNFGGSSSSAPTGGQK